MRASFLPLLLLAACGGDAVAPENDAREQPLEGPTYPELEPPTSPAKVAAERDASADAATVLKNYYAAIGSGDYDAALRMRSGDTSDATRQRFIDNFKAYETYRATVGTPSRPAEQDGWLYVEVPVMIYGSYRSGKGFGSSGSVTLRRAGSAPEATAAERKWHVYTPTRGGRR